LSVDRCRHSVCRSAEGDEERVTLRVDDTPSVRSKGGAKETGVLGKDLVVAVLAELLEERRRAFDIRKEEGDSAAG
jgi:hypothetical protein